jgi:hypothetical protein
MASTRNEHSQVSLNQFISIQPIVSPWIISASYVKPYDIILTASKDMTVRIWTRKGISTSGVLVSMVTFSGAGLHIGTFGDQNWVLNDPGTYGILPRDLQAERDRDITRKEIATKRDENLKLSILATWRGLLSFGASSNIYW